jgi:hypothetical protein
MYSLYSNKLNLREENMKNVSLEFLKSKIEECYESCTPYTLTNSTYKKEI